MELTVEMLLRAADSLTAACKAKWMLVDEAVGAGRLPFCKLPGAFYLIAKRAARRAGTYKDFLAKLKATGKSVKELLKEATGKGTPSVKDISAWDKKIADLKKALAEKRGILAELLSRVAALEAAGSA